MIELADRVAESLFVIVLLVAMVLVIVYRARRRGCRGWKRN